MSFFAQAGKPIGAGIIVLTNLNPSQTVTQPTGLFTDFYSVVITTNETVSRTVTISDGTTTLTYYVGGAAGGSNPAVSEQPAVPIRFKSGATLTFASNAVTTNVSINMRWLFSKT